MCTVLHIPVVDSLHNTTPLSFYVAMFNDKLLRQQATDIFFAVWLSASTMYTEYDADTMSIRQEAPFA